MISSSNATFTNESFVVQGIKTSHQGDDVVILRLPKTANVVGRFLVSYQEELTKSCTAVDYTTLWAILDDVEEYKPKKKEFKQPESSIEMLLNQYNRKRGPKKVYNYHSITEDPGNTGKKYKRKHSRSANKVKEKRARSASNHDNQIDIEDSDDGPDGENSDLIYVADEQDVTLETQEEHEEAGPSIEPVGLPEECYNNEISDADDGLTMNEDENDNGDINGDDAGGDPSGSQLTDHSYHFSEQVKQRVETLCPRCGEARSDYASHLPKCKGIDMMCVKCNKTFTGLVAMEDHLTKKHKEESEHYCQDCERVFITDLRLLQHNKYNDAKQRKCSACEKNIKCTETVELHKLTCTKERRYGCKECRKGFACHRLLTRHHNKMNHNGFVCRPCDLEFDEVDAYVKHIDKDLDLKHICGTCGKQFKGHIQLWKHEKYTHNKTEHVCDICGWKSGRKDTFVLHMKKHKTGGHICELCQMSFMTPAKLNSHKSLHNPAVCHVCSFVFLGHMVVRRHIKKEHPEIQLQPLKKLETVQDETAQDNPETSNNEEVQCNTDTKFSCLGCGLVVADLERARLHLDRKPSCSKTHLCRFCGNISLHLEALKEHERIHTGPFLCFYCKRGFLDWEKCSQHMVDHVKIRGNGEEKQTKEKYEEEKKEAEEKAQVIAEAIKCLDSQ